MKDTQEKQNIPHPLGMGQPRSPAYASVLDGTGGKTTIETGTTPSSLSPILLEFGNINPLKSTFLPSTQIGSDPPNSVNIPGLPLGLNNSPKPTPHPAQTTNIAHHYFVTEPPESPKSLSSNPFAEPSALTVNLSPHNSPTSPNPSTSNQKTLTHIADVSLVEVFNSLAIKRKAQDDVEEPHRSKILCLCAPDSKPTSQTNPLPITKPTPRKNPSLTTKTKTPHLLRRSPRKSIPLSTSNGNGLDVGNTHGAEDALCEVFIDQEFDGQEGDTRMVPTEVV